MSAKHLVVAVVAGLLTTPLSAQSVKAGIEAWQHADYDRAVAIWRPLAEKGDADAQFNLGQAYRLGRGVPINLAMAKNWFQKAATSGHLDAKTTLGLLLFENGDQAAGLTWLKQAAEQGEPRAELVYGTALYNGDGVTQDRILGYSYVSRAAGQGLVPARETLAQLDQLMNANERSKALALAPTRAPTAAKSHGSSRTAEAPPSKPKAATARDSAAAAPVRKPSKPVPAKPAVGPVSGDWRIQLGAFSQRAAAEAMYHRLSGNGAISGRSPTYITAGKVIRLQVGPYATRGAAETACRALRTPCFPVSAK